MTTIEKNLRSGGLVSSIERGLERILSSPTQRMREMRLELEREDNARRRQFETSSKEYLELATKLKFYLQHLPS